ncbi:methyltransferase [Paenibacillus sp. FSL L8-0470]|uniref:methyltransferase n=1 Tax=unclassified Paenibacillus TaxID=185978 RepID=UPI0030F833AC
MDKIIIELYIPAISQTHDVIIPLDLRLHEIEGLMAAAIMELSGGVYIRSEDTVICDKQTATVLDINLSARELGLSNGSMLMLI